MEKCSCVKGFGRESPGACSSVGTPAISAGLEFGRLDVLVSIRRCCELGPGAAVRGCRKGWMGLLTGSLGGIGGFEALTGSAAAGTGTAGAEPAVPAPPAF